MTSSRPPSAHDSAAFNESLSLLSPVVHPTTESTQSAPEKIVKLGENVEHQFGVHYSDGSCIHVHLPPLSWSSGPEGGSGSPLVARCISAASSALPKDLSVYLQTKWYATRNAPGPPCVSPTKYNSIIHYFYFTQAVFAIKIFSLFSENGSCSLSAS